jgi:beta-glucosidase
MRWRRISDNTFMLIVIPFLVLLTVTAVLINYLATSWDRMISKNLGQSTYKIVTIDDSVTVDDEYYKSDFSSLSEVEKYSYSTAFDIEAEGMVLLLNDTSNGYGLPLSGEDIKVSCFGVSSVDIVYSGSGSGSVDTSSSPTLKQALEDVGVQVNSTLWNFYQSKNDAGYKRVVANWQTPYFAINEVPWSAVNQAAGSTFMGYSDAAIVVISRAGGEGSDLTAQNFAETSSVAGNSGSYLELSKEEKELLDEVNTRFNNIIVLINANNQMELGWLQSYKNIRAAMWIGGVGQVGLNAVASAIVGGVNPSGRLVDTYAYDVRSAPASVNAGNNFWIENYPKDAAYADEADQYLVESEGIYVGYRYYETRYEDVVLNRTNVGNYNYDDVVQFPFGYGLSYTQFAYKNYRVINNGDSFTVSVTVKNEGDVAGKEVVQVYGQSPYTDYDIINKVEKSSVQLVGFAKTKILQPDEECTVTIDVPMSVFAAYDYTNAKTYILDAGKYYLAVGTNAHNALNNILTAKGYTIYDGMTYNGSASLAYSFSVDKLDAVTYSVDDITQNAVTNQFDGANICNYEDGSGFKYLTRNDWVGTYPAAFADRVDEKTGEKYKSFSLNLIKMLAPEYDAVDDGVYEEVTVSSVEGLNLATLIGLDYSSQAWEDFIDEISMDDMLTLIRMGAYGNVENEQLNCPATMAKDGPAGLSSTNMGVSNLMSYPTQVVVASTWNVALAEQMGKSVGEEALYVGIQGWYAPALNIHRTAYGGRNFEYYSEDAFISGKMGANVVTGAKSKGLICYIKHFALNDTEGVLDSFNGISGSKDGIATFNNEQAIREIYLRSFEIAVKEGGANGVMNAFNRIGAKWCGHSSNLLNEVLRNEWGFVGCVITDNAGLTDYMEIKAGLAAGTDIWLNWNKKWYTIDSSQLTETLVKNIKQAAHRALYVTANSAAMNGLSSNTKIVEVMPPWKYWLIAGDVLVALVDIGGVVWVILRRRRTKAMM